MMKVFPLFLMMFLWGCQATVTPEEQAPPPPHVAEETDSIAEPLVEAPAKPRFVIENIMNLAPDTLENILGVPSLKRKEKDVRVWLFRNEECVLHLYFYLNENGDFRLDYVDTSAVDLSADNPTVSPNACLNSHVVAEKNRPDVKADPVPSSSGRGTGPQPDRSGS